MICDQCKKAVHFAENVNGRCLCTSCFPERTVPTPLGSIHQKSWDLRFVRGKDGSLVLQQKSEELWEDVPIVEDVSLTELLKKEIDGAMFCEECKKSVRFTSCVNGRYLCVSCCPEEGVLLDTGEIWRRHQCAENQQEIDDLKARLKEVLDVLHDIVVLLRKEPAVQGPKYSVLGFRATSILSKRQDEGLKARRRRDVPVA